MPLRPARPADIDILTSWLPHVAQQIDCRCSNEEELRQLLSKRETVLYSEDAGMAIVAYQGASPTADAVRIRLLAVAPGERRLGIGSRAALALERRLRKPTARIYVLVPAQLGLALYFWLRLGYRPLTQRDWPARPEQSPSVWMERELTRRS